MTPFLLYAALVLSVWLLLVMLISLALFLASVQFRSSTVIVLCVMGIFVNIQTWSLLMAAIVPAQANAWLFWGSQVAGLGPWSLIAMAYVTSMNKGQHAPGVLAFNILLMVAAVILFVVLGKVDGVDQDILTDMMAISFAVVAGFPPAMLVVDRLFRHGKRYAKARDMVLPVVLFSTFAPLLVHRVSPNVLGGFVVAYALLHPLVYIRVLVPLYLDGNTVAKHPERHIFLTLQELDLVPNGVAVFLNRLTKANPADTHLDALRVCWFKTQVWQSAKWESCPSDTYTKHEKDVCEYVYLDQDPPANVCPETAREDLFDRIASTYQKKLADPFVQLALHEAFSLKNSDRLDDRSASVEAEDTDPDLGVELDLSPSSSDTESTEVEVIYAELSQFKNLEEAQE